MEYLNKNKLLSQVQFGFRKNFSATDALVYATEELGKEIDCNQLVQLLSWIYQRLLTLFHMKFYEKY